MKFKRKNKFFSKIKGKIKGLFHLEGNSLFNIPEIVVVIVISTLFGVIVGCILTYGKGIVAGLDNKYVKELINTYDTILENYYGNISEADLLNAAVDGMVDVLGDQYSYYMNKSETSDFNQTLDGSYVGIGATIKFADTGNEIIELFENSPAEKAGLKVGDIIIGVNGVGVSGYSANELSNLLVGENGTTVDIRVKRGEEVKEFSFMRGIVTIPSVSSKLVENTESKIGYIDIDNFAANTYYQFKEHLTKLEKNKIDSLIIDVRDNTGGHLTQVNKILSMFFDKKTLLYQIETKNGVENIYATDNDKRNYKVVILINYGSASASEILASAFQDNYKNVTIVGTKSYGKGTIQSAIRLSTGASLKYTSQKWLTSKGVWLDNKGVVPNVEVKIEDPNYTVTGEKDLQYLKAVEILKK